jgi:hypothetical protein
MLARNRKNSETQPLLRDSDSSDAYHATVQGIPTDEGVPKKSLNEISRVDLVWVLAGLWSAVFLGALDGESYKP